MYTIESLREINQHKSQSRYIRKTTLERVNTLVELIEQRVQYPPLPMLNDVVIVKTEGGEVRRGVIDTVAGRAGEGMCFVLFSPMDSAISLESPASAHHFTVGGGPRYFVSMKKLVPLEPIPKWFLYWDKKDSDCMGIVFNATVNQWLIRETWVIF